MVNYTGLYLFDSIGWNMRAQRNLRDTAIDDDIHFRNF